MPGGNTTRSFAPNFTGSPLAKVTVTETSSNKKVS